MHSARFSILAGTALALILTATATAAPQNSQNSNASPTPQPAARDYSTPGSMPKPSSTMDDGIRFRGSLPASRDGSQPRRDTAMPLAPASNELRTEQPARPAAPAASKAATPEAARAQAEPEPVTNAAPAPERMTRPVAPPKPVAAAVAPAPNAASEAEVGNKLREIITGKQFDRVVVRKPDRDAVAALYQKGRSFQPLWVSQGAPSERAKDALEYLKTIDADGLDPKDYPMPKLNV